MSRPRLSGVVVHWHGESDLERLLDAWPRDARFELVVVDNGSTRLGELRGRWPGVRWIEAGENLGFAGGANRGVGAAAADLLLILNPDARPRPGALERLLEGFERHADAAGLVPRLVSADGTAQHRWQLARLPRPLDLLAHALFVRRPARATEPPAGTAIEQPAAAALALRRSAFDAVGGFDASFHPAWFDDVDLAGRLARRGLRLLYHPASVFEHGLGASVAPLGYAAFLVAYDRNLLRYARKHHRALVPLLRLALFVAALLRLAALPLRRPRRARTRAEAARGLLAVASGALRWPAGR
jgi:GT2 family glycosyltransferase